MTRSLTWRYAAPAGWVRFSVGEGADSPRLAAEIAAVVEAKLPAELPRDSAAPHRENLRRRLQEAITEAAAKGAVGVVLPTQRFGEIDPASSISEIETFLDPGFEVSELVSSARSEGWVEADVMTIDDVEVARLVGAPAQTEVEGSDPVWAHQIVYVVPIDAGVGRWLMLNYSLLAADASPNVELTEVLVMLFDAMMTTFRVVETSDGSDARPADPGSDR